jgi:hypothetical protein
MFSALRFNDNHVRAVHNAVCTCNFRNDVDQLKQSINVMKKFRKMVRRNISVLTRITLVPHHLAGRSGKLMPLSARLLMLNIPPFAWC